MKPVNCRGQKMDQSVKSGFLSTATAQRNCVVAMVIVAMTAGNIWLRIVYAFCYGNLISVN